MTLPFPCPAEFLPQIPGISSAPSLPDAAQDAAKSPLTCVGVDILEGGPGSLALYSCPRTFISPASRATLFTRRYHSSPLIFLPCFLSLSLRRGIFSPWVGSPLINSRQPRWNRRLRIPCFPSSGCSLENSTFSLHISVSVRNAAFPGRSQRK